MRIKFNYSQLIFIDVIFGRARRASFLGSSLYFKGLRQNYYVIDVIYTFMYLRICVNLVIRVAMARGCILFVNNWRVMQDLTEK